MTLIEKIENEMKIAMKMHDSVKLNTLRMLKSACKYSTIEKYGSNGVISDEIVLAAIRKQIKQREDAIASFEEAGRVEMATKEKIEKALLCEYLPPALSDNEVIKLVQSAIEEIKMTMEPTIGSVMKLVQVKSQGSVDGKRLSQEVQKQLKKT